MLRCSGSVEVPPEIAEELLKAADQYMLEGLKRLCEAAISSGLCTDNLAAVHELSENYNAPQLARRCVLYSLEHYEEMVRISATPVHLSSAALHHILHINASLTCQLQFGQSVCDFAVCLLADEQVTVGGRWRRASRTVLPRCCIAWCQSFVRIL